MSSLKKIFASFSSKERLLFVFALVASILAAVSLVWIFFLKVTDVAPARGGELTEGLVGQPQYVNPLLSEMTAGQDLVRLTFANLPDLAEKIDSDKDNRTFRVRLKEGLLWSDGQKLTSDDIIFTLQKLQDPETSSPYYSNWQGVVANRVSELEVQFNLAAPYAFFSETLHNFYPIPKHIFADTPAANWRLSDYNLKPVGSGPFVVESYEKRQDGFITAYHLVSNELYSGNRSYIENFNLRFFSKAEDLLKSFNSGQVDAIADLDPESLRDIHRTYNLSEFSLPNYYAVFFNQSQNQALADINVRKALSLGTDRESIIRGALNGYGKPTDSPIPPGLPGIDASDLTNGDIASATAILDSSGWKQGEDGVRVKSAKSGDTRLEIKITVPDVPFLLTTGKLIAEEWAKLGAKVTLETLPSSEILAGPIKNRSYEAVLFGNLLGANGDLYAFWHSSERYYPGLNLSLYSDKSTDKLLETVRQNTGDRLRAISQASANITSVYPAVFLYSPSYLFVASKDLRGVKGGFLSENSDRLREAKDWYVKTTRVFK